MRGICFCPNLIDDAEKMKRRGVLTRKGNPENLIEMMDDVAKKRKTIQKLFNMMKIKKWTLSGTMEEAFSDGDN